VLKKEFNLAKENESGCIEERYHKLIKEDSFNNMTNGIMKSVNLTN